MAEIRNHLVNRRLDSVVYRQTEFGGLLNIPDAVCHEVDLDVFLILQSGAIGVTWDRADRIEGISIARIDTISTTEGVVNVEVGRSEQWGPLLGRDISSVEFEWQAGEADGPDVLWSIKLEFSADASVVLSLGELDANASPSYYPDSLLAIFDQQVASDYISLNDTAAGS